MRKIISLTFALLAVLTAFVTGRVRAESDYDMGQPIVKEIWVDPANGNDVNDGSTKALAIRTLDLAMAYVPTGTTFTTTGYRIMLMPGVYSPDSAKSSYTTLYGTPKYPVIMQAAQGAGTVTLPFMSASDCHYFYLIGINFASSNGADAFGASGCDHILLKNCTIVGFDAVNLVLSQNVVSFIGSKYCYLEDCALKNSSAVLLSMSSVQYGHVVRTTMDSTLGNGIQVANGSAYLFLERNRITNVAHTGCVLGGVSFLDVDFSSPWFHYDAYDIRVDNTVFANCGSEAFIARGCYAVLVAYNTFYKCGMTAPTLFVAGIGRRTCAGDKQTCSDRIAAGAWGTLHSYSTDDDAAWIPNKHLLIFNNLFYDPAGSQTLNGELSVWGSRKALAHATCPKPALADDDIQIKGNVIFNGPPSKPLGLSDTSGCQDTNASCTRATIAIENQINQNEPDLASPDFGNFHPVTASALYSATLYVIPDFTWNDLPGTPLEPAGELSNTIAIDNEGYSRAGAGANAPGAFVKSNADVRVEGTSAFLLSPLSSNPASTISSLFVTIAHRSQVTVGVYDLLGREISRVVSRSFDPGRFEIALPVGMLEMGVYIVRVSAEGQTLTRKLTVAR